MFDVSADAGAVPGAFRGVAGPVWSPKGLPAVICSNVRDESVDDRMKCWEICQKLLLLPSYKINETFQAYRAVKTCS